MIDIDTLSLNPDCYFQTFGIESFESLMMEWLCGLAIPQNTKKIYSFVCIFEDSTSVYALTL